MVTAQLDGFTVGVTASRRADEQAQLLRRHGAKVIHGAVFRSQTLDDERPLLEATQSLLEQPPDLLIANTAVGMRSWLDAAEAWGLGARVADLLRNVEVFARGPKAAGSLAPIGATVAWRAPTGQLSELLAYIGKSDRHGQRIALQRDGSTDPWPIHTLESFGASVVELPVYEWTGPVDEAPAIRLMEAVCAASVDAVTFTSRPAIDRLVALAEDADRRSDLTAAFESRVVPVCVGPVCLDGAFRHGFTRAVAPDRPLLGAMVSRVVEAVGGRGVTLVLATGEHLHLQGSVATVDGKRVELSSREASVLHTLARRPGVVVSRTALLNEVWGETALDEHALEMTVSRLRRRLGHAGAAVKTVVRRGYLLTAS